MLDSRPEAGPTLPRAADRDDSLTPVVTVLLAPIAAYAATRLGIELLNRSMDSAADNAATTGPMIEAGQAQLLAVLAAVVTFGYVVWSRMANLTMLSSWASVQAERPIGEVLADLPASYRVLAGAYTSDDGDLVDHVVIGPTGVFTIEARTYRCGVVIDGHHAMVNGRVIDGLVAQVSHTAGSIGRRTRCPVTPIVCVHGGVRVERFLGSPVVDGVRFCDGSQLLDVITDGSSVLTPETCVRVEREILDG